MLREGLPYPSEDDGIQSCEFFRRVISTKEYEMTDASDTRGRIIHLLEQALALADEINDGDTGYAIERALDLARAQAFKPFAPSQ